MENNYFDDIIKSKLENVERQNFPNDWGRMEEMLDKDDKLQRRLLFYKGAELLIFTLVVLGVSQLWKNDWTIGNQNQSIEQIERIEQGATLNTEVLLTEEVILEETETKQEFSPISIKKVEEEMGLLNPLKPTSSPVQFSNDKTTLDSKIGKERKIIEPVALLPYTPSFKIQANQEKQRFLDSELGLSIDITETALDKNEAAIAYLEILPTPLNTKGVLTKIATSKSKKRNFFWGLQAGFDALQVRSPYYASKEYDLNAENRYGLGFSAEASFGYQHKSFDWETGVRYAEHTYQPRKITLLRYTPEQGFKGHKLKNITLKTASIPLKFRYHFLKNDKWSFYAVGGASLDIALLYDYEYDYYYTDKAGNLITINSANAIGVDSDRLPLEGEGLLLGDKMSDNLFVTADAGFGIEHYLNNDLSIFAEPLYQHQIFAKQLQPNKDVFNTLSLNLGARFSL